MSFRSAIAKQVVGVMIKGGYEDKTLSHLQVIEANPGTVSICNSFVFARFWFGHALINCHNIMSRRTIQTINHYRFSFFAEV